MLGISSSISQLSNEAATPSTKAAKVNLAISKKNLAVVSFLTLLLSNPFLVAMSQIW